MKELPQNPSTLLAAVLGLLAFSSLAQIAPADDSAAKPYKILATTQIPAAGGIDYVTADSVNRRVYVACGKAVSVFVLKKVAGLPETRPVWFSGSIATPCPDALARVAASL